MVQAEERFRIDDTVGLAARACEASNYRTCEY